MEKKTFKIIKNMLFPVKTTIEMGPEGITYKGKFVAWNDIVDFSYSITSINRALNYQISYSDKNGKNYILHFMHSIAGSKKKKEIFAEIYGMFHEGVTNALILPNAKKWADDIRKGLEVTLAGAIITNKGITVPKPMRKKQTFFIPWDQIEIEHRDGSGGFDVKSNTMPKERGFFQYSIVGSRYLLATLEQLFPEQAKVYSEQ